jgi:hypothetical protein
LPWGRASRHVFHRDQALVIPQRLCKMFPTPKRCTPYSDKAILNIL